VLEQGNYKNVRSRPVVTYREPITEQIVALNAPDLSKDEELWNSQDAIKDGLRRLERQKQNLSKKITLDLSSMPQPTPSMDVSRVNRANNTVV